MWQKMYSFNSMTVTAIRRLISGPLFGKTMFYNRLQQHMTLSIAKLWLIIDTKLANAMSISGRPLTLMSWETTTNLFCRTKVNTTVFITSISVLTDILKCKLACEKWTFRHKEKVLNSLCIKVSFSFTPVQAFNFGWAWII